MSREFKLGRKNKQREQNEIKPVTKADWKITLRESFLKNIVLIKEQGNLASNLEDDKAKDIYRNQVVLLMSSLDYLIHEVLKFRMTEIFIDDEVKTKEFENFSISLITLKKAIQSPEETDWFEEEIKNQISWNTYMSPKKIKFALKLISEEDFFEKVAQKHNLSKTSIIKTLNKIYDRRNDIVHEMDIKDTVTLTRNDIALEETLRWIDFIEKFGLVLFDFVKNP